VATCLVTGGAGFLGSHLVEALVAVGHHVRVLDDFSTGKLTNLFKVTDRIRITRGSILEPKAVQAAVKDVEWVFHFAALPSVQRSIEDPRATHEACATGTLNVLKAACAAKVRRVVYAGSSSAYGASPGRIRREDDLVCPLSPYAAAKLAGEHYCSSFTSAFGIETVRLRFFNIFGPRQDPSNPYSGVIPIFIDAMANGRAPTIHGDGLQSRDFTYVANAVQASLRAARSSQAAGKVYNVGAGKAVTLLELVESLNRLLGTTINPVHGPARAADVRHSQADFARARQDLGYEPEVSFGEGLRRTLEAYKNEGHDSLQKTRNAICSR
jgi:UDP-glucose 4-epimerase